jgi:CRP-like cAMP-binding protein
MHQLFYYINKYVSPSVSKQDYKKVKSHFISKKFTKNQYLLQKGELCKYFAFIVKGALRQYYVDERGVEYTINLCIENWWAGDRESFVMDKPSIFDIDVVENSEVLLITRENVIKLCREYPTFNELLLKLDERNNIAVQRRIASMHFTAEKRYKCFVEYYPFFINRFPQHIIASYLGVTKDTLSRIRRQLQN